MVLSDHEEKVLLNLQACVASNSQPPSTSSVNANGINTQADVSHSANDNCQEAAAAPASTASAAAGGAEDELFDPEDADSCDDLDDSFQDGGNASQLHCSQDSTSWEHVSDWIVVTLHLMHYQACCYGSYLGPAEPVQHAF